MRGRPALVALHYAARELRTLVDRARRRLGVQEVQLGDRIELPPELQRVRAACAEAYLAYRPQRYDGTVLFFRAAERHLREADPLLMWRRVASSIEVEEIPGSHYTLIQEPAAERVAAALLRRLAPEAGVGSRLREAA